MSLMEYSYIDELVCGRFTRNDYTRSCSSGYIILACCSKHLIISLWTRDGLYLKVWKTNKVEILVITSTFLKKRELVLPS